LFKRPEKLRETKAACQKQTPRPRPGRSENAWLDPDQIRVNS
jgi:hypothetical protein